ncbi:MAG: hypothetical protein HY825_13470 [Acidobacteria bacterium]|nr:hypothetical protein [Acidobacteriota bacterium]
MAENSRVESGDCAVNLRAVVGARVRAEHEPAITAEIDRRMAAVEAALAGGVEPPPPPRKPRSDRGTRRATKPIPAEPDDDGPRIFMAAEDPADETKPAEAEAPEPDMPPQDIDEGTTGEDPRPARRRRAHKDAPPVNVEPAPVNETPAPVNTGHSLDARDNGYTPLAPTADTGAARQCRCGHASGVHGTDEYGRLTGCMVGGCGCRRHVEADPLGLDGWVPPSERKEVSDEAS